MSYHRRTTNEHAPKCKRCGHGYWPYADLEHGPHPSDLDQEPYCDECLDIIASEEYEQERRA